MTLLSSLVALSHVWCRLWCGLQRWAQGKAESGFVASHLRNEVKGAKLQIWPRAAGSRPFQYLQLCWELFAYFLITAKSNFLSALSKCSWFHNASRCIAMQFWLELWGAVLGSVGKCSSKTSPAQQRRTDGGEYILNRMQSRVDPSDRGRVTA